MTTCECDLCRDPDGLNAARGIVHGLWVALMFWAIVLYPWWKAVLPNG